LTKRYKAYDGKGYIKNFSMAIPVLITGTKISICSSGYISTGTRILHSSSGSGSPEILYETGIPAGTRTVL
jgi:hypothetical protein